MTNRIDQPATISGENESVLVKKAQTLISTIKQTHQLEALGHPEGELGPLVEKIMGEDLVPQSLRGELSVLLVRTIRKIRTEELLESPEKLPNQIGLYQVDVEKQYKRAKLAITSINEAPQNENGEVSRDYIIAQIQKNNNENYWGRLAIVLKRSFDGSMNELVIRLNKLRLWEDAQKVGKTIEDSMAEFPAVEPVFKQTSKEVGIKEIKKTLDPKLAETIKTLIKTLIVGPSQFLVK